MRNILRWIVNLLISGFIIWGASVVFPNLVFVRDFKTLASVTFLLWVLTVAISLFSIVMMLNGIFIHGCGCSWIIAGFFMMAFSKMIALHILSAYMSGFFIKDFWLECLIAILCSIFAIPETPRYDRRDYYDHDPRYY